MMSSFTVSEPCRECLLVVGRGFEVVGRGSQVVGRGFQVVGRGFQVVGRGSQVVGPGRDLHTYTTNSNVYSSIAVFNFKFQL